MSENDARGLLGYIEKKDELFEVIQLTHGFAWFYFDTLHEATEHFTRDEARPGALDDHVLSWMNTD